VNVCAGVEVVIKKIDRQKSTKIGFIKSFYQIYGKYIFNFGCNQYKKGAKILAP
jgi:hypothetical protein